MADTVTPGGSPAVGTNDPPSAPTLLDESAAQFTDGLNALTKLVPGLVLRHPETERFVRKYQAFNRDVITTAIAAVEANPELDGAKLFNLDRARAAVQYGAYKPAINQTRNLAEDMQFTYDYVTAVAIEDSLQIYAIAKAFARVPASAKVAAHANNIKRDLRRPGTSRKKKAAKTTPSTPAPASVPQPKQ
jgi:peptidoglycan hydrolase-like protein with peptidoglycan-binding domain